MQQSAISNFVNKYLLYLLAVLVFVGVSLFLIPESNWIERIKYYHKINELEEQIEKKEQELLNLLQQQETLYNDETLEQLAREKYHMVKANEEVFLITE